MKKRSIVNLIRYYSEQNDPAFRTEAYQIAMDFNAAGDTQIAEYIVSLLSDANTFVPQVEESDSVFLKRVPTSTRSLPLPQPIASDLEGILNAVSHNAGINKFLFQGPPGTGKTEATKQLARILSRDLFAVDTSALVDSHLGQTAKNIAFLFEEIGRFLQPNRVLVLFDEIDSLALDRINANDVREMGRATSTFLRELDSLDNSVVLVATTNLYDRLDKALIRRFYYTVDFSRYTREDLLEVAESILEEQLALFHTAGRDVRLFRKILSLWQDVPYPGDIENVLKTCLAFSKRDDPYDYLKRLYKTVTEREPSDIPLLRSEGFTVREIEKLTGVSKSSIARKQQGEAL